MLTLNFEILYIFQNSCDSCFTQISSRPEMPEYLMTIRMKIKGNFQEQKAITMVKIILMCYTASLWKTPHRYVKGLQVYLLIYLIEIKMLSLTLLFWNKIFEEHANKSQHKILYFSKILILQFYQKIFKISEARIMFCTPERYLKNYH